MFYYLWRKKRGRDRKQEGRGGRSDEEIGIHKQILRWMNETNIQATISVDKHYGFGDRQMEKQTSTQR